MQSTLVFWTGHELGRERLLLCTQPDLHLRVDDVYACRFFVPDLMGQRI